MQVVEHQRPIFSIFKLHDFFIILLTAPVSDIWVIDCEVEEEDPNNGMGGLWDGFIIPSDSSVPDGSSTLELLSVGFIALLVGAIQVERRTGITACGTGAALTSLRH